MKRIKYFEGDGLNNKTTLYIYTAVGLNYQPNIFGKEKYPQNLYPIQWYIGLDHGAEEDHFASQVKEIVEKAGPGAIADVGSSMAGQHINSFFRDFNSFKRVINELIATRRYKTLHVEQHSGEVRNMRAEELASWLLEKAHDVERNVPAGI